MVKVPTWEEVGGGNFFGLVLQLLLIMYISEEIEFWLSCRALRFCVKCELLLVIWYNVVLSFVDTAKEEQGRAWFDATVQMSLLMQTQQNKCHARMRSGYELESRFKYYYLCSPTLM